MFQMLVIQIPKQYTSMVAFLSFAFFLTAIERAAQRAAPPVALPLAHVT